MSANVAGQYGWYQISGMATAAKATATTFAAGAAVGVAATGLVAGTAAGKEIVGALAAAAATNGPATVLLHVDRPRMQGGIT
jgi:predicted RecA/RadA family phage recombinase